MCKGQLKVKSDIIQMYSTPSGFKVESKGRESFSFSLIQRESRELLLPLSISLSSSLRQNPPNNQRTISHPSPLEIYWFFGISVQFFNPSDFQPTTNCSLLPQISFEPLLSLSKTDFAIAHIQCGHFVKLLFDQSLWIPPSPQRALSPLHCGASTLLCNMSSLLGNELLHCGAGFIKVCRLEWQPWEGKWRGCIYTPL